MTSCETIRERLEEYLDGELARPEAADVEAHLEGCAACASELASLKRLESVLRASSRGEMPEPDRYIGAVRRRIAFEPRRLWTMAGVAAVAACLSIAVFAWLDRNGGTADPARSQQQPLGAMLEDPARQAELVALARLGSAEVLDELKRFVREGTPRQKQSAAVALAMQPSDDLRAWLVEACRPEPVDEVEILDIGAEPTDDELVLAAFELARSPRTREDGIQVLRKLHRGGLNRRAVDAITDRVRDLLASGDEDRALGLEVLLQAGVRFPVADIVELLDAPVLGDRALEFLKARTGQDFGRDKAKWREYIASQT